MRAVAVTRTGGPDALQSTVPLPDPHPGWVRIKVKASGVNESEVTTRKDEDSRLRPGQQVATMMGPMGRSFDGSCAQYVTVPAGHVIPFETDLLWEVVGTLPEMFQTAYGSSPPASACGQGRRC